CQVGVGGAVSLAGLVLLAGLAGLVSLVSLAGGWLVLNCAHVRERTGQGGSARHPTARNDIVGPLMLLQRQRGGPRCGSGVSRRPPACCASPGGASRRCRRRQ